MFKHVVSALVLIISLQGCGGGGGSSSTPVGPPPDTTPPVITISGDVNVNHEQGTAYSDAGATATDNVDGDVSVEVSGSVLTKRVILLQQHAQFRFRILFHQSLP